MQSPQPQAKGPSVDLHRSLYSARWTLVWKATWFRILQPRLALLRCPEGMCPRLVASSRRRVWNCAERQIQMQFLRRTQRHKSLTRIPLQYQPCAVARALAHQRSTGQKSTKEEWRRRLVKIATNSDHGPIRLETYSSSANANFRRWPPEVTQTHLRLRSQTSVAPSHLLGSTTNPAWPGSFAGACGQRLG